MGARPWVEVDLSSLPVPRVWAMLSPDPEAGDKLLLGVELCSRYGDPVVHFGVDIPWRRPRPWQLDADFPAKFARQRRFRWTRPT